MGKYNVNQIKVLAYNREYKSDFTIAEKNLFLGLAYCYDWFKANPNDKADCEKLMNDYIQTYLYLKEIDRG